jgi:hypothetical protein
MTFVHIALLVVLVGLQMFCVVVEHRAWRF